MQLKRALLLLCGFFAFLVFTGYSDPISISQNNAGFPIRDYTIFTSAYSIKDPAWSPDGSQIAFVSVKSVMNINKISATGDSLGLLKQFYTIIQNSCYISPDEQYIIYTDSNSDLGNGQKKIYLYSSQLDSSILINKFFPEKYFNLKWSRDSQLIYYVSIENSNKKIVAITPEGETVFSVSVDSTKYFQDYSVAPDNQSIAWSGYTEHRDRSQLWLYSPAHGMQLLLSLDLKCIDILTWSPDGNYIAYYTYNNDNSVKCLNIYSKVLHTTQTLLDSVAIIHSLSWSDDGKTIFFCGSLKNDDRKGVWAFSVFDQKLELLYDYNYTIKELNSDGSSCFINFHGNLSSIWTLDLINKKTTCLVKESKKIISQPNWAPDGSSLVFTQDFKLWQIPASGGQAESMNIDSPVYQYGPVYSPDGSEIAFQSDSSIYVVPAHGGEITRININNRSSTPVWSPDGKQIAYICHTEEKFNDSLMVCNYTNKHLTRAKSWFIFSCQFFDWSKRHPVFGSYILYMENPNWANDNWDMELRARNMETGQVLVLIGKDTPVKFKDGTFTGACWSPDGESIAWSQNHCGYSSLSVARIFTDEK